MRAMKDSGIEWIGQIPQEWSVGKTIFGLEIPITDGPHETPPLYSEGVPFVSAEAVSTGNGRINFDNIRGYISEEYYEECCKKYIPQKEDIYMIKSGATTGKIAIVDTDDVFTIWSPLAVFRCNKERCISRFLFYTLRSDYYQKQVESKWSFGTQQNIGMRTLERLLICYPPVPEQERIADYLDTKCAEIDTLIAAKEKTNALLKERRQSIIYEAVTKGLNPDAPMKDSGVEWIGEIPESWAVGKLGYFIEVFNGDRSSNYPSGSDIQESGVPFLTSSNLEYDVLDMSSSKYISEEKYESMSGLKMELNDIIYCLRGSVGKCSINKTETCGTVASSLMGIRCKKMEPEFLLFVLKSPVIETQNALFMNGTCAANLSAENVCGYLVPIPAKAEQTAIAEYLQDRCTEMDELISANEATIQKLKEYRQSIIYEAVTGKIEI